jgi:AraC-like DNA-binding protein
MRRATCIIGISRMEDLPSLHVLAGHRNGFCSALCGAVAEFTRLRFWSAVPPPHEVHTGDLIVVDLSDPPRCTDPRVFEDFLVNRATLCLALGNAFVAPSWVEIACLPQVRVFQCGHEQSSYDAVITEVLERVRGPTSERITRLVLQAEPALHPVECFVQAVCLEPWRIRRPRDLAKRCALSLAELRRRCAQLGFARVEHFMICVRLVAYEQLVAAGRLSVATARLLAGFTDPSNMRRHTRRAALRSPPVAHALESLHPRRPHLATHG